MALLELKNITRRFGDFTAVDDVSLAIDAGQSFLDGLPLAGMPPEKRPLHTGFQSYALFPSRRVGPGRRVCGVAALVHRWTMGGAPRLASIAFLTQRNPPTE